MRMTDIVMSTHCRLHRNLIKYPFVSGLCPETGVEVTNDILNAMDKHYSYEKVDLRDLSLYEIIKLKQSKLYSNELKNNERISSVITIDDKRAVLVNEFDQLVIASNRKGENIETCLEDVMEISNNLEKDLDFAFDKRFGYLTTMPIICGTGIVFTIKLHLPGIRMHGYRNILNELKSFGFALIPKWDENNKMVGDIFYLTNTTAIGNTEEFLAQRLKNILMRVKAYEEQFRYQYYVEDETTVVDKIYRSIGIAENARIISEYEALDHLSNIKLGIDLNLIKSRFNTSVFEDMEKISASNLQMERGCVLDKKTRQKLRGDKLRKMVKERIV